MPVQALFLDQVYAVHSLRYVWSDDGAVLLALDCQCDADTHLSSDSNCSESDGSDNCSESAGMTFGDLRSLLAALCPWQKEVQVIVGMHHALAEVLTVYHAFEWAKGDGHTLMLVSTPPDEYFEAAA